MDDMETKKLKQQVEKLSEHNFRLVTTFEQIMTEVELLLNNDRLDDAKSRVSLLKLQGLEEVSNPDRRHRKVAKPVSTTLTADEASPGSDSEDESDETGSKKKAKH